MPSRQLKGDWNRLLTEVADAWPRITLRELAVLTSDRDELMRLLRSHYRKSYTEIDREVTAFELREGWDANTSRPSRGIPQD
jgi:hypothetical protein